MPQLKDTKIYRGGVTAPYLNPETSKCSYEVNIPKGALDLRFQIASKGGGTTEVLHRIGLGDLALILESFAEAMPETIAGTLSDCAALANKKILGQLTEARRVQSDEKVRLSGAVEKLEGVEEFVSQKWCEAPPGQNENEAAAKSQLEDVLSSLHSLL
jgi:hypothetical protein